MQKDFKSRDVRAFKIKRHPVIYCKGCADVLRPFEHDRCNKCKGIERKFVEKRIGFLT